MRLLLGMLRPCVSEAPIGPLLSALPAGTFAHLICEGSPKPKGEDRHSLAIRLRQRHFTTPHLGSVSQFKYLDETRM